MNYRKDENQEKKSTNPNSNFIHLRENQHGRENAAGRRESDARPDKISNYDPEISEDPRKSPVENDPHSKKNDEDKDSPSHEKTK